jgi:signal transduction histidine kinase
LKQEWNADFIQGLAREIWWLQPPFRNPLADTPDPKKAFEIDFVSEQQEYKRIFNEQLSAIADIWTAKLVGKNVKGEVTLSLQYKGEDAVTMHYSCGLPWTLQDGNFEIRIFNLKYRQPYGITVQEAREYLNEYGGVHVYDAGFHLPYYGDPRNDWLKIEFDSAHRLSMSKLLPENLQVPEAMMLLPTLSRIFGVVNVDTAEERDLEILITRDRFRESTAFTNLRDMVRWALDFYATREKLRNIEQEELLREVEIPKTLRVREVLDKYRSDIPQDTYEHLRKDIEEVTNEIETDAEIAAKRVGLMGSLATAGISALAYQHETKSQFHTIEEIIEEMGELATRAKDEKLSEALTKLKESLSLWVERARATNALFSLFSDPENLQTRKRFLARKVVDEIREQVKPLARGTQIETSRLDEDLLLPKASLAEWSAIFQNVFINAFNALLDSEEKLIDVCSRTDGIYREILIQDTGCGVDLKDAEELFRPFVRKMRISPERRALGYGGTGLGLTIVRMIAHNIACEVSFVEPEKGFNTAFSLRWGETE